MSSPNHTGLHVNRSRVALRIVAVLLVALALSGCGKKGTPQPPPDEPSSYPRSYPRA